MEALTYLCVTSSFVMLFVGLFRCFFCHGTGEFLDKHKRIPKCEVKCCHGDWPWGDLILAFLASLFLANIFPEDEIWYQATFIVVLVLLRIFHKLFSIYVSARDLRQLKKPCPDRVPVVYRNPYDVQPVGPNNYTSSPPLAQTDSVRVDRGHAYTSSPPPANATKGQVHDGQSGRDRTDDQDQAPEVVVDGVKEKIARIEEETSKDSGT